MAFTTTIDAAGRVVIPKRLRDELHLLPNTRLRVTEEEHRLVLERIHEETPLIDRDGVVLIGGELVGSETDVRQMRDERVAELLRRSGKTHSR